MSDERSSPISLDLERVAGRLAATAVLGDAFCDRLTRSLTQLYALAEAAFSDEDLACFDTILVRVAPTSKIDARIELSDRLATTRRPPKRLLLTLARDEIEIARPILENSPALTEDDLVEIARASSFDHMEAIAGRPELTIRVTDILVLRGDDVVRRVVVGNGGAHISDKSFTRLSLQAREDTILEARLVRRGDLPGVVVRFLMDHGGDESRAILAAREAEAHAARDPGPQHSSIRAAEMAWLEPYDFEAALEIRGPLANGRRKLDGFVRRLAQTDCFPEIAVTLSDVSGVPLETMKHVLVGLDTTPFVVIARALRLEVETVREMMTTGPWLHRLDDRARAGAVRAFEALDPAEAESRLKRWKHP